MPRKTKGGDLFLVMKINQIAYVSWQFLVLNFRLILPSRQAWHELGRRKDGDNHRQSPLQFSWMILSLFSRVRGASPASEKSAIAAFGMEGKARIPLALCRGCDSRSCCRFGSLMFELLIRRGFLHGSRCKVCTAVSKQGICCSSGASRHPPCPAFLAGQAALPSGQLEQLEFRKTAAKD